MTDRAFVVASGKARAVAREEACGAVGSAELVWIHLDRLDETNRAWLDAQPLPPVAASALTAVETRPRAEKLPDGAIVNLRGPGIGSGHHPDMLASIRLWVSEGRVISVTFRDLAAIAEVERLMLDNQILDPGDLVCSLAVEITRELDPDVADLGDTLDDCEEMFGEQNALTLRRRIAAARAKAIAYRRFVAPQRTALEKLATSTSSWFSDDDRLHLSEAADRAARMAEELEAIRERAALIHEQLTDLRGELIDTRSLVISVVALVFLPLTFLTGLLGMNVAGIPFAHEPWAFAAVCGACVAVAAAVAVYFIRARWFR